MVHFTEINQISSPYSMLKHIGRVATPKFVPRNCLRYSQTTLMVGGEGWENLCEVLCCIDYVVYVKFNGDVQVSCFRHFFANFVQKINLAFLILPD